MGLKLYRGTVKLSTPLPKKDGANALSGAGSLDTATTRLSKTSRTKNLIIEYQIPNGERRPGHGEDILAEGTDYPLHGKARSGQATQEQ